MYFRLDSLHPAYMAKKTVKTNFKRELRRTFIREWRKHRKLTLEELAERVGQHIPDGFTHASLSRIENRKQPYSQPILEALAVELGTDPASLLIRDPSNPQAIWTIWDQAKPGEQRMIEDIARTIVKKTA